MGLNKQKSLHSVNEVLNRGVVTRNRYRCDSSLDSSNKNSSKMDYLVLEEPLEIMLNGELLSITMRTPGNDDVLAVGFLFSEGLLASAEDILQIEENCKTGEECNIINIYSHSKNEKTNGEKVEKVRRGTLTAASCGVCGRQSIDDMIQICEKQSIDFTLPKKVIAESPDILASQQPNFSKTGGCHGAAAFNRKGDVLANFEDIGRHNAVDKVIGDLILRNIVSRPLNNNFDNSPALMVVSGRLSFEIVQKCAVSTIPVIASVSAPSSLAVDLAEELGITIASFVRGGSFSLYSRPERIQ